MLRRLTDVVRETEQFRIADAEGKLVRLPTSDTKWRKYEFRAKPGDVNRRPAIIAPYQCR
jgi:hypothetical protein